MAGDALDALRSLVEQAKHAERSVGRLGTVHYAGVREITSSSARYTMFAIAIKDGDNAKDIFFARTPELAKFIAMLMNVSGDVVGAVIRGIEESKSAMI